MFLLCDCGPMRTSAPTGWCGPCRAGLAPAVRHSEAPKGPWESVSFPKEYGSPCRAMTDNAPFSWGATTSARPAGSPLGELSAKPTEGALPLKGPFRPFGPHPPQGGRQGGGGKPPPSLLRHIKTARRGRRALHKPREHPALWDVSIHLLEISPHYAQMGRRTGPPLTRRACAGEIVFLVLLGGPPWSLTWLAIILILFMKPINKKRG